MANRTFLGRYSAVRLLGEGGMGQVYLAQQVGSTQQVVVKVMNPRTAAQPRFRALFQREIEFMARFQHPYAVALIDASINDPGGPCIVMEYIQGTDLEKLLRRHGRLPQERVGRLLGQLCSVLKAAHDHGIIHRDLKPANIMVVNPDTPQESIKVLDFGLSKLDELPHLDLQKLQGTAEIVARGTPEYICPEQVRGEEMDHRGDLYSVGVILFQLLTGRLPFTGRTPIEILEAHATKEPPPLSAFVPPGTIKHEIEWVVEACLAKNPMDRPEDALHIAEVYSEALGQNIIVDDSMLPPVKPREGPLRMELELAAQAAKEEEANRDAVVRELEAWMPESIAVMKIRGFVQDVGGQVVDSAPGVIRLRAPKKSEAPAPPPRKVGLGAWFGGTEKAPPPPPSEWLDVELRMEKRDPAQKNLLHVSLIMRAKGVRNLRSSESWTAFCDKIYRELRAYLGAR